MDIVFMNISASVMIFLTLLMRKAAKRFVPNSVFCLLWLMIGIHLILPFPVETSFSFLNPFMKVKNEFKHSLRMQGVAAYENLNENIRVTQDLVEQNKHHLFYIWLAGCCIVTAYFIWEYIKEWKSVQDAEPLTDAAWIYEDIRKLGFRRKISLKVKKHLESAATWGIWNPTIYFPKEFAFEERDVVRFVLYHECGHIKYFHFLLKLLHILLVCLYWYNPFVWIMYIYQERDLEITSDRFALRQMEGDCRAAYAMNLVIAAKNQKREPIIYFHFYKKKFLEERIEAIMSFKKMTVGAIIMTMLIPLGMTTVFATTNTVLDIDKAESIINENVSIIDGATIEEVPEEIVEEASTVSLFVDWDELRPYAKESVERAASYYELQYYEYVTYGSIPPKTIILTTEINGYTYKGTLTRGDYIYTAAEDKYTGFYNGKIYRQ